jgi:DNA-binding response OmpR family regulator
MRVLLAEDDAMIGEAVRAGLRRDGFAVDWVRDGVAAEGAVAAGAYDLMLLDLGLPARRATTRRAPSTCVARSRTSA